MPLVFQYGSNCNAARLNEPERLGGAAVQRGRAQTVDEYELAFDAWSQTNGCAASDLIRAPGTGRHAWGALYDIPADRLRGRRLDGLKTLSGIEGSRYEEKAILVRNLQDEEVEAITFVVRPLDRAPGLWTSSVYVGHIVNGLRAHDIPEEYVFHMIDTAVEANRNALVAAEEQIRLITDLRAGSSAL